MIQVHARVLSVVVLLLALTGSGGMAQEPVTIWFLTPSSGPLAEVTQALLPALTAAGATVSVVEALPDVLGERDVVVAGNVNLADPDLRARLHEWLPLGGGLVLLVEPSARHYEQATEFLTPLGAQVTALSAESDNTLVLGDNPLTAGLRLERPVGARMEVTGDQVEALARAGGRTALARVPVGEGAVIVLPASLLVTAVRSRPPDAALLTLGDRAALWANSPMASPVTLPSAPVVPAPGIADLPAVQAGELPLETTDFAGLVLYDSLAADDTWPQINGVVQGLLREAGLEIKGLDVRPGTDALAVALRSEPALAVLGSWRKLTETESVAVYYYLLGGGRVLALGNATSSNQIRLTYLNEALNAFSVLLTLGRPAGTTAVNPNSPLQDRLRGSVRLPAGIAASGDGAMSALVIEGRAAMATARRGRGRLLALDARPLPSSAEYRAELKEGLTWLLAPDL